MDHKFSGYVEEIEVKDGQIISHWRDGGDSYIIGERKFVSEFLDFASDVLPALEVYLTETSINDGFYYVYFTGSANFGSDQDLETGAYEGWAEAELDYVHWEELKETP